eukprot:2205178-Alexandrium_andersonii.AAC.1
MSASLVGSEMCIRDSFKRASKQLPALPLRGATAPRTLPESACGARARRRKLLKARSKRAQSALKARSKL